MASSPNNTAFAQPSVGRPQASHPYPCPVYQQQQYYLNNSNCQNLPPRSQTQIPISSSPPPAQNDIVYPLASSGRGFVPGTLRPSDHSFPLSNNTTPTTLLLRGTFNPSSSALSYRPASPSPLLSHPQYPTLSRQPPSNPNPLHTLVPSPPASAAPIKGIPLPCQLMVRISGGASLYALCRSWLRNGVAEESQLLFLARNGFPFIVAAFGFPVTHDTHRAIRAIGVEPRRTCSSSLVVIVATVGGGASFGAGGFTARSSLILVLVLSEE
ncbi:unnamed protein product [Linum tenue]|uniref:Uncharacterized protein n=1 Tax=Linum tenue TaxID=586396 RepID=A0AAV0L4Q8_9ROSI|nr:unnamed protein product [Linum tenue]